MDWSKAKTIIIIIFLVLNVFLFVSVTRNLIYPFEDWKTISRTKQILEQRGIKLTTEIPPKIIYTGRVKYAEAKDFFSAPEIKSALNYLVSKSAYKKIKENEIIIIDGDKKIKVSKSGKLEFYNSNQSGYTFNLLDYKSIKKVLRKELNNMGLKSSKYKCDKIIKKDNELEVKFIRKYKQGVLFNLFVVFNVKEKGIKKIEMVLKKINGIKSRKKILSACQLLLSAQFEKGTVIKDIQFGYLPIPSGKRLILEDSPVWRIIAKNNKEEAFYYDAYTGIKLKLLESKP